MSIEGPQGARRWSDPSGTVFVQDEGTKPTVRPRTIGPAPTTERGHLLARAMELTQGARNETYGGPVTNMARQAEIMDALKIGSRGDGFEAHDAAMAMLACKLARLVHDPTHADSYVDAMAYLGMAAECAGVTLPAEDGGPE